MTLTGKEKAFVRSSRVGYLATADRKGCPLNVPFCYVSDGRALYSPIDEKPKKTSPRGLKRIRNVLENPQVSVVVNRYEEDWGRLGHVIINGRARILARGKEHQKAVRLLRRKYPQYRSMAIHHRPVIQITPTRCISWGVL